MQPRCLSLSQRFGTGLGSSSGVTISHFCFNVSFNCNCHVDFCSSNIQSHVRKPPKSMTVINLPPVYCTAFSPVTSLTGVVRILTNKRRTNRITPKWVAPVGVLVDGIAYREKWWRSCSYLSATLHFCGAAVEYEMEQDFVLNRQYRKVVAVVVVVAGFRACIFDSVVQYFLLCYAKCLCRQLINVSRLATAFISIFGGCNGRLFSFGKLTFDGLGNNVKI